MLVRRARKAFLARIFSSQNPRQTSARLLVSGSGGLFAGCGVSLRRSISVARDLVMKLSILCGNSL